MPGSFFQRLKDALMKSPILVYPDWNQQHTSFIDTSKYAWSALLMQEHTTVIDGKTQKHQHSIMHVMGLFMSSQCHWGTITKEVYAIYNLSFYLSDAIITL